jgi:type II secretion system protein N
MAPLTGFRRKLAYGLFFAFAFLLALSRTFPAEAVRDFLVLKASEQGMQLRMDDVGPAGFAGISAEHVRVETREGTPLTIDSLSASIRLLPLLVGRQSLAFDARMLDGRLQGAFEPGKSWRVSLNGKGIDLGRADTLRKALGVDVGGRLNADVDLRFSEKEPAKSSGKIDITVDDAVLRGGEMEVPGMGGGLTLPKLLIGKVVVRGVVKDGKATMEKLSARSEDLEANADGLYFVMQPRMEYASLFGKARVKISDTFWAKGTATSFRGLMDMALSQAKGPDGSYGFQIYGTLSHPQARPGQ